MNIKHTIDVKTLYLLLLITALGMTACGDGEPTPAAEVKPEANVIDSEGGHSHLDESEITERISLALVPSEIVVGPNRFAVGVFDAEGELIHDAEVHFHYYDLRNPDRAVYESEADAARVQSPDGSTTIYTHDRDFTLPGLWGVEVEVRIPGKGAGKSRIGVEVLEKSAALSTGDSAPYIHTRVLSDVAYDTARLTSAAAPVEAMHKTSLDEALDSGRPTLLLFATPGYCQTRFCGPAYDMIGELMPGYDDRLNFVYVEVFDGLPDPSTAGWQATAGAKAFGIESEPWVYFIDEGGEIVYRLEGMFSPEELKQQIGGRLGLES